MPAAVTTNELLRRGHCTGCRRPVPAPHECRWAASAVDHHRKMLCTRCAIALHFLRRHPARLGHVARTPPRRPGCTPIACDFVFIAWEGWTVSALVGTLEMAGHLVIYGALAAAVALVAHTFGGG